MYFIRVCFVSAQPSSGHARQLEADADHGHHDEHHHGSNEGMDSAVGISLVLGFIFMLLIDQLANAKQQRSAVVSISGADIEVASSGNEVVLELNVTGPNVTQT